MKKLFFFFSFIVIAISINAQEHSPYPIEMLRKGISIPTLYNGEPIRIEKLVELIADNDIAFLDLKKKYDTPLKIKNFKASEEYINSIRPEFVAIRDSVMKNDYFYLFDLHGVQYDLQTKRFNFRFLCDRFYNTNLKGYIGIGNYINLSCPSLEENGALSIGKYYVFLQSPIVTEELAAQIEDGKYKLMFVFKFDKIESEQRDVYGGTSGVTAFTHNFILCKTSKIYLYDPATNSIIADWSSLLTVSKSTSKKKK